MQVEQARLDEAKGGVPWRKWGPYLSERQWGTVREDYSDSGNAWEYFTHDQARSRTYRRGEDGLAGICDDKQQLCLALALWNGRDPILKERLFGLTNSEGNHGEDVKELYYYLDSTPTHSYMRYLYKYPQLPYPYEQLLSNNRRRSRDEPEYELIDTGVFSEDRYFDVFVEFAKADPEDILVRIRVCNRGPESAQLHVLPTLWFRNRWTWDGAAKPSLTRLSTEGRAGGHAVLAEHPELGKCVCYFAGEPELLFTENESNNERLFGTPNPSPHVKDGINDYIVEGRRGAVNPAQQGTKVAAHYPLSVAAGAEVTLDIRLSTPIRPAGGNVFGPAFDAVLRDRKQEADAFYASVVPASLGEDQALVMRQALAGMLWSKQFYDFDVNRYLAERGVDCLRPDKSVRNRDWFHMVNEDIISMPDKWEYPWYAAWDLAFHAIALSLVDAEFAKQQLELMVNELYLHPNGQMPAYEWNFGDVNPPVHAFAALFIYRREQQRLGRGDKDFLGRVFSKLMMNFTWWVNRKDRFGRNVFEGGFLGLDNISVFDRSAPLPNGGHLEQADGTAWMALFCQNMFEMCVELAADSTVFEHLALKYADHFLWIARAVNQVGDGGMWDEEDGFYYDVLRAPDGSAQRLKVRSLVGLLPMCAVTVLRPDQRERMPMLFARLRARLEQLPALRESIHQTDDANRGYAGRGIAALVRPERLRRILARVLDDKEFLSPYGIRSLSQFHKDHPFVMQLGGAQYRVEYLPAESDSGMFGGNSNWRGPVWMPMNVIVIRALIHYYLFYGDSFRVECPTGSGRLMNLFEVAQELSSRLSRLFLRDPATGTRPVFGGAKKLQQDPHFRDYVLFYEYFHGDNGAGIGASHQTGWTGLVAALMELFASTDAASFLKHANQEVSEARPIHAATG